MINCNSCLVAFAVQVLKVLPGQKHIMIQDHAKWVSEFYRDTDGCWRGPGESPRSSLNLGLLVQTPPTPLRVRFIPCRSQVAESVAPQAVTQSRACDRLVWFLLLTPLKDGCWDVLRHERDVHPQRWAGRQMMSWEQQGKGSGSKEGSWHTRWSRWTLPGTVQTKHRNSFKRLFPFRQNKAKKKAARNSTLQFLVAETIFLSRVC